MVEAYPARALPTFFWKLRRGQTFSQETGLFGNRALLREKKNRFRLPPSRRDYFLRFEIVICGFCCSTIKIRPDLRSLARLVCRALALPLGVTVVGKLRCLCGKDLN